MVNLSKIAVGFSIASILLSSSAYAATIRGYEKDQSSRLVIESDKTPAYTVEQSGNRYTINLSNDSFDSDTAISLARINKASVSNGNLTIELGPSGSLRHFKTGKKIIIDALGPSSGAKPSTSPKKAAAKQDNTVSVSAKETQAPSVSVPEVQAIQTDPSRPTVHIADDHVVQLTAAETVSVGAFVRRDMLWIVVDKEDFLVPPQIKGKQKELFSPFERINLPKATAFRSKLPNSDIPLHLYAEGGGLIWRVVLTTDAHKVNEAQQFNPATDSLHWSDPEAKRVIKLKDPDFKDDITLVTTEKVGKPINIPTDYVEFSTLPSYIGLAFLPKTEDINVSINPENVTISRENGLHISSADDLPFLSDDARENEEIIPLEDYKNMKRIFRFDEWQLGGIGALLDNERLIISSSSSKDFENRINDLMTLARLELSNGRAAEAIGFLDLSEDMFPEIAESPEFISLRGAAHALSDQYDLAFNAFLNPLLDPYDEINLWKAYSLAGLEDWNQAKNHLPDHVGLVSLYPAPLQQKLSLVLAEIALRQGRVGDAEDLLELVRDHEDDLTESQHATLDYLSGEAARQNNDLEDAYMYWGALSKGKDDLYRAKAGLALTRLSYEDGKISSKEAIDRLEHLRYAWRGDDLETQINYRLGLAYIDHKKYIQGLMIMRKAASRSPDPEFAKEIAAEMTDTFNDIFTSSKINELDPLDTITLYEEFSELAPSGEEGQDLVQNLASRLIDIDLLGRASNLLTRQVDNELSGAEGAKVATRLAGIQLTDGKPSLALKNLTKARSFINNDPSISPAEVDRLRYGVGLLEAHAYSKLSQPDNALITLSRLNQTKQTLTMRADVAWRAKRWQAASDALEELINREAINLNNPLSDDHRDMILNWAITLNLSDNRYILNSVRDRFGEAMKLTSKAKEFDVITRQEKNVFLADRKTIEKIVNEVDLFKGFLDSYKQGEN